jgi:hypothetical protein
LVENANAVKSAAAAIDAAIVAKGGTTAGGLRNAAAAIAALPSRGEDTLAQWWSGTFDGDLTYTPTTIGTGITFGGDHGPYRLFLPNLTSCGRYILSENGSSFVEVVANSLTDIPIAFLFSQQTCRRFEARSAVSVGIVAFCGCPALDELILPSATTIAADRALGGNASEPKDVYLDAMNYDASNPPSGFPWGLGVKGNHYCTIHFGNCNVWRDNNAWVVKA